MRMLIENLEMGDIDILKKMVNHIADNPSAEFNIFNHRIDKIRDEVNDAVILPES